MEFQLSGAGRLVTFGLRYKPAYPMKFHLGLWPFALALLIFASCVQTEDPIELLPSSPEARYQSSDIVWEWSELYLAIERDLPGFRPAPTCRALAYIHMGAYETVVPGMDRFQSLRAVISDFPEVELDYQKSQIHWPIALNAYFARTFQFFLYNASAEDIAAIERLQAGQLSQMGAGVPQGIVNTSIEWGQKVANAIITYSETDQEGSSQVRVARPADYFPPAGVGLWSPTGPDQGDALFPYWGRVRAFAAHPGDLLALPPAIPYSTDPGSAYYQENLEVADMVQNMTSEDRWVAEFWSDDIVGLTFSPPARIFAIANQMIKLDHLNLEETLHLYCRLGIAMNDASVAAWNSKYTYNTERPVHYISKYIDPAFKPILGEAIGIPGMNPSFPGYPSGHSTFAGVSWRIFDHFFGTHFEFTDLCHYGRTEFNGFPRTYTNWKQMAEENAYSRIPLGVHIRQDCTEGIRLGSLIADRAMDLDLEL